MTLCIAMAGKVVAISATAFSLSWTHSVEKVEWREDWSVSPTGLELRLARVKGSGAGMEPGDNAVLIDGWWQWQPELHPIPELRLAASGATGAGWRLCHSGGCLILGADAGGDSVIAPCDGAR